MYTDIITNMQTQFTYQQLIHWMQDHLLTCPSSKFLHIECPGRGFQRSVLALLQGHLHASLALYPATIPIMIMIVFTALHLKYNFLHGATCIKYLQVAIAVVILVFYIYKVIHLKIFT